MFLLRKLADAKLTVGDAADLRQTMSTSLRSALRSHDLGDLFEFLAVDLDLVNVEDGGEHLSKSSAQCPHGMFGECIYLGIRLCIPDHRHSG